MFRIVLVDVRNSTEFRINGKIPGTVNTLYSIKLAPSHSILTQQYVCLKWCQIRPGVTTRIVNEQMIVELIEKGSF